MELSVCLLEYYKGHCQNLTRADAEARQLEKWIEYFPEALVKEVRPPQQKEFLESLVSQGYSKSYVESIFKSFKAAVTYCLRYEILSTSVPFVKPTDVLNKYKLKKVERWRPITIDECALLLENANTDRLVRYVMILIACACRPSAAIELTGKNQIDLGLGTITLLLPEKTQTNKYRPIVKLPSFIRAIYHDDNICSQDRIELHPKRPLDSIRSSWNTARKNAGLDILVTPYSIRHTIARWLRLCGVMPWHTSTQLGHQKEGYEVTELYAPNDPNYLDDAAQAIEAYFAILYERSPKLRSREWLGRYRHPKGLAKDYQSKASKV
ncbi:hypothetical protein [Marinibactrum halimedae]|uniref:hypothetical protein n=1 Tax=Marinibactrum halimedae TaxID=1444977 RepID=UPI001E603F1D|nr:hypothetical protein [Marinibactrum halimedae]MCD9458925.1 hypothetical protein [Marinibactrum halimedae]